MRSLALTCTLARSNSDSSIVVSATIFILCQSGHTAIQRCNFTILDIPDITSMSEQMHYARKII